MIYGFTLLKLSLFQIFLLQKEQLDELCSGMITFEKVYDADILIG